MSVKITFKIPQISEFWIGMYDFPESPIVGDSVDIASLTEIPGQERGDVFKKILQQEFKAIGIITDRQWKKNATDGVYLYVDVQLTRQ